MGAEAVRRLMAAKGLGPDDVDALIVATVTPDMLFPATACLIQDRLGLARVWGFDLSAACSGFLYALTTGAQFVASGAHRRVIVVGADLDERDHRPARPDDGGALRRRRGGGAAGARRSRGSGCSTSTTGWMAAGGTIC